MVASKSSRTRTRIMRISENNSRDGCHRFRIQINIKKNARAHVKYSIKKQILATIFLI